MTKLTTYEELILLTIQTPYFKMILLKKPYATNVISKHCESSFTAYVLHTQLVSDHDKFPNERSKLHYSPTLFQCTTNIS